MKSILASSIVLLAATNTPRVQGTQMVAGDPTCVCTAQCAAYGDPHMIDFNGDAWKQTGSNLTIYTVNDFAVTAQTGTESRITSVTFGSRTYNAASDCKEQMQSFPDEQDLDADGVVSMELVCYLKDGEYIFDLYLNKTDTGAYGDFDAMEKSMGAGGLCLTGPQSSSRRLRGDEARVLADTNLSPPSCVCQSICEAIGDPEVYGFYGGEEKITTSETFTLYASQGFKVSAGVQDERIKVLYFGDDTYTSSSVCKSTSDSVALEYTWENGNRIQVLLQCEIKSSSNGYFFDVGLLKEDVVEQAQVSTATTFKSIESSEDATGACLQ